MDETMEIKVHDVGAGSCAFIKLPGGETMLLDCGRNSNTRWTPSSAYCGHVIDQFVIQNLDEDHVKDLPDLLARCRIKRLFSNPTVGAAELKRLKQKYGMDAGVEAAHTLLTRLGSGLFGGLLNEAEAQIIYFWTRYSSNPKLLAGFNDTNNLSVPVLIRWRGFSILFSGDLAAAGWRALLSHPTYNQLLTDVHILVAPHHGRDDGRCEELFSRYLPYATIFSDGGIRYATQETVGWYARRTVGVSRPGQFVCDPPEERFVFTTRRDGCITITVDPNGEFSIGVSRDERRLIGTAA